MVSRCIAHTEICQIWITTRTTWSRIAHTANSRIWMTHRSEKCRIGQIYRVCLHQTLVFLTQICAKQLHAYIHMNSLLTAQTTTKLHQIPKSTCMNRGAPLLNRVDTQEHDEEGDGLCRRGWRSREDGVAFAIVGRRHCPGLSSREDAVAAAGAGEGGRGRMGLPLLGTEHA